LALVIPAVRGPFTFGWTFKAQLTSRTGLNAPLCRSCTVPGRFPVTGRLYPGAGYGRGFPICPVGWTDNGPNCRNAYCYLERCVAGRCLPLMRYGCADAYCYSDIPLRCVALCRPCCSTNRRCCGPPARTGVCSPTTDACRCSLTAQHGRSLRFPSLPL